MGRSRNCRMPGARLAETMTRCKQRGSQPSARRETMAPAGCYRRSLPPPPPPLAVFVSSARDERGPRCAAYITGLAEAGNVSGSASAQRRAAPADCVTHRRIGQASPGRLLRRCGRRRGKKEAGNSKDFVYTLRSRSPLFRRPLFTAEDFMAMRRHPVSW